MTINLIPPKLKKEKAYRKTISVCFSFLSVIFILFLIITGTAISTNYFYKADLKLLRSKIDDQNKTLERYSDLKNEVSLINSRLDVINGIDADRILWNNVVIELARSTPSEVQIKTFTSSGETKKINLTGVAATRRDIAKFKEKLENSKNFQNVVFSSSSINQEGNDFNFNLSCELEEIK